AGLVWRLDHSQRRFPRTENTGSRAITSLDAKTSHPQPMRLKSASELGLPGSLRARALIKAEWQKPAPGNPRLPLVLATILPATRPSQEPGQGWPWLLFANDRAAGARSL